VNGETEKPAIPVIVDRRSQIMEQSWRRIVDRVVDLDGAPFLGDEDPAVGGKLDVGGIVEPTQNERVVPQNPRADRPRRHQRTRSPITARKVTPALRSKRLQPLNSPPMNFHSHAYHRGCPVPSRGQVPPRLLWFLAGHPSTGRETQIIGSACSEFSNARRRLRWEVAMFNHSRRKV